MVSGEVLRESHRKLVKHSNKHKGNKTEAFRILMLSLFLSLSLFSLFSSKLHPPKHSLSSSWYEEAILLSWVIVACTNFNSKIIFSIFFKFLTFSHSWLNFFPSSRQGAFTFCTSPKFYHPSVAYVSCKEMGN